MGTGKLDWFKAVLAASALMAGGGIAYYFGSFLPDQARALEEERKLQERKQRLLEEARQALVHACRAQAEFDYSAAWDENCASIAEEDARQHPLCLARGLGRSFCDSLYKGTKPKDCRLPSALADRLEKQREQAKDRCEREAL